MHPPIPHILVRAMASSRSGSRYYRPRAMSLESPKLIEALTIYEKLKRCQEDDENEEQKKDEGQEGHAFNQRDNGNKNFYGEDEPLPLEPFSPNFDECGDEGKELETYTKYRNTNLQDGNYLYYSSETGLIQSKNLEGLKSPENNNYAVLLHSTKYWLDVTDPTENDLALLSSAFRVHGLTMRDIREGSAEEKLEMYNHYTFVSLKLGKEKEKESQAQDPVSLNLPSKGENLQKPFSGKEDTDEYLNIDVETETETDSTTASTNKDIASDEISYVEDFQDMDLSILLFSDFVITIHKRSWESSKNVLGFLSILLEYGNTQPLPEWVLFSIFVEMTQEAKRGLKAITPSILNMRAAQIKDEGKIGVNVFKLSGLLRRNFLYEFELHKLYRFVKPKLQVLGTLQIKGRCRFSNVPGMLRYLANVGSEFDDLLDEMDKLSRIVERSQDTFLALASVQQSVDANEMGEIMKRISEIAMIFLPVQAISGFLGMNVQVPFQDEKTTFPFWTVVMCSVFIAISLFFGRRLIFCGRKYCSKAFMEGKLPIKQNCESMISKNFQSFVNKCRKINSKKCT